MAPSQVEDLFDINRIPDGIPLLLFIFYIPIGALLCIIRILFCVQLAIILSIIPKGNLARQWILRVCGCILGIVISSKKEKRDSSTKPKILVSNNISELDSLVVESVESHELISRNSSLPMTISWVMGYQGNASAKTNIANTLKEYLAETDLSFPALVFPEESATNGKISLLKFSHLFFELSEIYQPVVLTTRRPSMLPVKVTVLNGGFWSDLLWTFFVPYTFYEIRYLPPMEKIESSSAEDFAKRICKEMSDSLGLNDAQFDVSDKREFIKRLQHVQPEIFQKRPQPFATVPRQLHSSTSNSKLDNMIHQVKDVLPQVPFDVIRRDLATSKSVDATLANLLEGKILYLPLTAEGIEDERRQQEKKKAEAMQKSLGQTRLTRNQKGLSFQEKKKIMIEEARRQYLIKHPEFSC